MAEHRLRLSNADGDTWDDPSEEQIDRHYSRLNLRHRFLVLDRLDVPAAEVGEHYLQLALNDDFSVVIEYREGGADAHYRAEVTTPSDRGGDEMVRPVLLGWAAGRPGWGDGLSWVRWDTARERPWDA
ncbi:hypothetical protein [Streptomyces sp. NPDC088794]|uniref:hypothetical protein n=1 Tax=Streptomyces sp. NPDC088794 TaxID=3365902 RepID=UPI0037F1C3AA